jgi:hypothetical protein
MVPGASVRLRLGTHTACRVLEHTPQTVTLLLWGTVPITFRLDMGAYHAKNDGPQALAVPSGSAILR